MSVWRYDINWLDEGRGHFLNRELFVRDQGEIWGDWRDEKMIKRSGARNVVE